MRFPSRLLAANLFFMALVWGVFYVVVTLITVAIAVFGTLRFSAWESAIQVSRWFLLFVGVALIKEFMPLYIAHGQTRRQFGWHAAVTTCLYAPAAAALLTLGYLLEAGLYGLAGWSQALQEPHLYDAPTQVPLVFVTFLIESLVWITGGAFMMAGFYRWRGGGLLTVPVGIALIVLAESSVGAQLYLPLLNRVPQPDITAGTLTAVAIGLACFLVGLALTWPIIRDVPLRNKPS
ncbi:hypothetical protein Misp01_10810 [Microtetraspora sp. NBRC 13810]|uniref:hypothetical protein n=1 Tax=Microtetraspora sp. NBRC 13810 TaxID=3030990 RepID=UPI0024A0DE1A|nr:hypothetical protein [Microtetraspora sp. NBRC 13810]GLW05951.1 hypothetical protein Misp01_10810 [Microtetraspora sp. NBRC 13810]